MSVSKKDYEAVAAILARQADDKPEGEYEHGEEVMRRVLARELARYFASASASFDNDRFLAAAKVQPRETSSA